MWSQRSFLKVRQIVLKHYKLTRVKLLYQKGVAKIPSVLARPSQFFSTNHLLSSRYLIPLRKRSSRSICSKIATFSQVKMLNESVLDSSLQKNISNSGMCLRRDCFNTPFTKRLRSGRSPQKTFRNTTGRPFAPWSSKINAHLSSATSAGFTSKDFMGSNSAGVSNNQIC